MARQLIAAFHDAWQDVEHACAPALADETGTTSYGKFFVAVGA